jgi:hypothetical protein
MAEKMIEFGPVEIDEVREHLLNMDIDLDLDDQELQTLIDEDPDYLLSLIL